ALAFPQGTPPFSPFPGSLLSFGGAGRPSPASLQTQLTEGCSRAAPQDPKIPLSVYEKIILSLALMPFCIALLFASLSHLSPRL
ncbi:hypothetical protein JOQ06_014782, partial [Pogonophryne albipinna]